MPRLTITVPGNTPQPYRFQLDRTSVMLGRGSENDIVIDSGSISVKHAQMRRVKGGYELRDLGSTNGTKLDGDRCDVIRLENGLQITLGEVEFDFLLSDEELEKIAAEVHEGDARPELPPVPEPPPVKELPPVPELPPVKELPVLPQLPPVKEAPPVKQQPVQSMDYRRETGSSSDFGTVVWFIILAAAAFFVGLAVHFKKDTGGSFIDAIKAKFTTVASPAGSKPATAPAQVAPEK